MSGLDSEIENLVLMVKIPSHFYRHLFIEKDKLNIISIIRYNPKIKIIDGKINHEGKKVGFSD